MSLQRRRGQEVIVYPEVVVKDRRGNRVTTVDLDGGISLTAAIVADRGSRAEVPGEQAIEVYNILVDPDVDVGLWARVKWRGRMWDVDSPAKLRWGTRHTRHQTVGIRLRPEEAGNGG